MYADTVTGSMGEALARDRAPPRDAGRVQPGARHHAGVDRAARSATCSSRCRSATTTRSRSSRRPPQRESPAALAAPRDAELEAAMQDAARRLDFERAAELRDRIKALRKVDLRSGDAGSGCSSSGADLFARPRRSSCSGRPSAFLNPPRPGRPRRRLLGRVQRALTWTVLGARVAVAGPARDHAPGAQRREPDDASTRRSTRCPTGPASTSTRTPRRRSSTSARPPRCGAACARTSRSRGRPIPRPTRWCGQIRDLEYIVTANELEAMILESNLVQEAPAALQHHPARRQALPVPQAHHQRGVPAAGGGPPGAEGRRELLRPVLPGHRDARDAATGAPAVPAAHLPDQDRRHAVAAVPAVLHPPLQRALHGLGDARRATRETVQDVERFLEGKDDDLAAPAHARDGDRRPSEMKFERAAALRDQIQALNTVRERQKMISTEEEDQDVVGVVRQGSDACVQLFFVRKGRLLGRESFFFERVSGLERRRDPLRVHPPVLRRNVVPPPEILLSEALPEADLTGEWLVQRRGRAGRARWRPSAGASATWWRWPRRTRRSRCRPTCSRAATASRSCWRSSSARSACPGRRTGSRASTSPPSRARRRWPRWWCGRTAT